MAHIVAIEQETVPPQRVQLLFDQIGDGRLARSRQAGEPQQPRRLSLLPRMRLTRDIHRLPMHVLRPAQRMMNQSGRDRRVGFAIDQDEATQRRALRIGLEHDALVGEHLGDADVVEFQRLRGQMRLRVDVDDISRRLHARAHRPRADLQPIAAARHQRRVGQPDDRRLELVRRFGRRIGSRDHVAARAIHLVGQHHSHRFAGLCRLTVAIERHDPCDLRRLARGHDPHRIAHRDATAGDRPGKATEIEVRPVNPLHRQPERARRGTVGVDGDRLQMRQQRRAAIPRHGIRPGRDIGAGQPRQRNGGERLDPDPACEVGIVRHDRVERRLIVADQVHLVHRQHDLADADQVRQERMPPRLRQHALARIDQDYRAIGGRRARHHVARILFVARRIGDDELALLGREEAIGDVDRNALLALGGKPVDQQREVDILPLRADAFAVRLQLAQLILEDRLRIVQQPPDQRRLAVIDRPAGDEAQHRLGLMRVEIGMDIRRDQRIRCVSGHANTSSLAQRGRGTARHRRVVEGASPHTRASPYPPPPSRLRRATSPWRGRTGESASIGNILPVDMVTPQNPPSRQRGRGTAEKRWWRGRFRVRRSRRCPLPPSAPLPPPPAGGRMS